MSPADLIEFKQFPTVDFLLQNPPSTFTDGELHVIADVLTNPIIKRYFDTLLWNQIRDVAATPITELGKPETSYKHAYMKGCIGMLVTLASVEKPQPRPLRKNRK